MDIITLLFAIGLGFGLACLIFASLLSKSNDIGNSVGTASRYTPGIVYERSVDKMKKNEIDNFGISYIRRAEEEKLPEPNAAALVEQRSQI